MSEAHPPMTSAPRPPLNPWVVLSGAMLGISVAAPLVRLSHAHPLVIALWRLGFSLLIVAVALVASGEWREWRRLEKRDLAYALVAGAALAGHFWSWNASVHLTTIAASVTLVCLCPAFVALLSAVFLKERPTPLQLAGIGIAIAGALVITLPGLSASHSATLAGPSNPTLGNLLALLGAVLVAIYYVIGRHVRARLGVWSYVGIAYPACFVVLLVATMAVGASAWPQPPRELWIFAGLAIGPMLLGHTGMNWALRYRPAYVVNLTVLTEPLGASLIAAFLPWIAEIPPASTLVGGAIVLGGVVLAAQRR